MLFENLVKEFTFSETLYQITTPKINREDINFAENLVDGIKMEPWDNVREKFLKIMSIYQTSVKLWDCQRKGGPLDQGYPDFLRAEDFRSPIRRVKMDIPDDENLVRRQLKNLMVNCNKITDDRFSKKLRILNDKEYTKLAKAMDRILVICKNVMPSRAFNDDNIDKQYRTLMKNEALKSIKSYINGTGGSDIKYIRNIHSVVNTYSLAAAEAKPFGFFDDFNFSGSCKKC